MLPYYAEIKRRIRPHEMDDAYIKRAEAIVRSMTADERRHPDIVRGTRLWRITRGSGTSATDVRELLERFWAAGPPLGPDGPRYA